MKTLINLLVVVLLFSSCKKEEDDHNHGDTDDTTFPVVTLNSPIQSSAYSNGDTVFITGSVTDNELHGGTIILKNDTSLVEYFNQYHATHQMTSATINYFYVVSGITQNEAVTLMVTYEDHVPNVTTVTRNLIFMP